MRTIPHRELRNNSAAILRAVEAGESLTITNHGHAVAHLIPCGEKLPPLRSRKAVQPGSFELLEPVELDHLVQESIDYLRGER